MIVKCATFLILAFHSELGIVKLVNFMKDGKMKHIGNPIDVACKVYS